MNGGNRLKHVLILTKNLSERRLDRELGKENKERIMSKLIELGNGEVQGKRLKGPHAGKYSLRVGKFRIFYTIPKPCEIMVLDVRHREVAYSRTI